MREQNNTVDNVTCCRMVSQFIRKIAEVKIYCNEEKTKKLKNAADELDRIADDVEKFINAGMELENLLIENESGCE